MSHWKLSILLTVVLYICVCTATSIANFGEICNSDTECDSCKLLTCQNGTCACEYPEEQIFSSQQNTCVFKLGKTCQGYTQCKRFPKLPIEMAQRYQLAEFCPPNASCLSGKCECNVGFLETSNGTCEPYRHYGESCTKKSECTPNSGLVCSLAGKCDCNPTSSYYDVSTARCVTKFGFKCNRHSYSASCGKNAQCENSGIYYEAGSSYESRCVCEPNYSPTPQGKCEPKLNHGATCSSSSECNDALHLVCDNGSCHCKNEFIYNSTTRECLGLVGTSCDVFSYRSCVSNAMCREENNDHRNRKCRCTDNYYKTSDGMCEIKQGYDQPCSEDMPCQSAKSSNLFCDSGRCKCSGNDSFYDAKKNTCVHKIGSVCQSDNECGEQVWCAYNKCACRGFDSIPDPTGKYCVPGYGSQCSAAIPCNPEKGMVCLDGRCECKLKDHQYYDRHTKKCLTFIEGPCTNSTSDTCTPNGECTSVGTSGDQECRCKNGFVPVDRRCQLQYGEPCSFTHDDYTDTAPPACDRLGKLYCIDGTCKCSEFQYYDEATMKCRGLVGSKCNVTVGTFCVEGATCEGFRGVDSAKKTDGICRCSDGFLKDASGKCLSKGGKN